MTSTFIKIKPPRGWASLTGDRRCETTVTVILFHLSFQLGLERLIRFILLFLFCLRVDGEVELLLLRLAGPITWARAIATALAGLGQGCMPYKFYP